MKVLILGGGGFVGQALVRQMLDGSTFEPIVASRVPAARPGVQVRVCDATDASSLRQATSGVDAVVNCIMGDAASIRNSAACLATVLAEQPGMRLVHLSTISVYGSQEGEVPETTPRRADIGWYGDAKCEAERVLEPLAPVSSRVFFLRPGCIYGPGSEMWTHRIGRLLRQRRLGDLGVAGDGWTNLVHVEDVARAIMACLADTRAQASPFIYNLAAPDSPRWNEYFRDFALALDITPLTHISPWRLKLETHVVAPPLKILERILKRLRRPTSHLPDGIPPSLAGLWRQQIRQNSQALTHAYDFRWTPYAEGIAHSVEAIS